MAALPTRRIKLPTSTRSLDTAHGCSQPLRHRARPSRGMRASSLITSAATRMLSLEGNIGAGKSTLLRMLSARGLLTVDEPVAKWQSVGGGANLLELFYADPKRWAFTFQTYAFLSRTQATLASIEGIEATTEELTVVLERSLSSDKQCFATNCWRTGLFQEPEWAVYCNYHSWISQRFAAWLQVDGAIYLRTRPSTAHLRTQRRSRAEESGIPLEYLQQLHERHEEWLLPAGGGADLSSSVAADGTPVLVLDVNESFEEDASRQEEMLEVISDFIAKLPPREKPDGPSPRFEIDLPVVE